MRDRTVLDLEEPIGRRDEQEREIRPIYFPPNPPPLGVAFSLRAVDARVGAPPELAAHVMEPFYAPLSTRVVERSLTRTQETGLDDYVNRRAQAAFELRRRLGDLANIGAEMRLRALEEFAAWQTPVLITLEREAESMREKFIAEPLSRGGTSWYEWRGWKLGRGRLDLPREQTLFLESQLQRDDLKIVSLNVDENQQTAAQYEVLSIPTLLLFKDGAIAKKVVGAMPKRRLEAELEPALA